MRRIVLALVLASLSLFTAGVVAPQVHAAAPTIAVNPSTVPVGSTATVSGSGYTPYGSVSVQWQRPDGTVGGTTVYANGIGQFSFTLGFAAYHGTGTERITSRDNVSGMTAGPAFVTVTGGSPPPYGMQLQAYPNSVAPGGYSTITGTGFSPFNYVYVQWQRPNGSVGYTIQNTDYSGSFSFTLGFAPSNGCGNETLTAFDYGTGVWSAPYTIMVACFSSPGP